MENGMRAVPVMFQCSPGYVIAGYMVEQYHKGEKIAEQFIPESAYKEFCDAIGMVPVMEGVSA